MSVQLHIAKKDSLVPFAQKAVWGPGTGLDAVEKRKISCL